MALIKYFFYRIHTFFLAPTVQPSQQPLLMVRSNFFKFTCMELKIPDAFTNGNHMRVNPFHPCFSSTITRYCFLTTRSFWRSYKLLLENRCLYYKVLMILIIWIDYCEDPARSCEHLNFSTHFFQLVASRLEDVLRSEVEFKNVWRQVKYLLHFQEHQPDEQFWKFALTGSSQNTEFKLWSCENWTCLQTVLIKPVSTQDGKPMALKAVLDLSAQYLLLSDIHRKIVYVLKLEIKDDKASLF